MSRPSRGRNLPAFRRSFSSIVWCQHPTIGLRQLTRNRRFCYHLIGMSMLDTIRAKRDQVYAIAREHKAEKLWVFGSCARGEERENSDIDFLVKYSPEASLFDDIRFERSLSALFSRGVDLVSSAVLPREVRFANRVCKEAVPV